MFPIQESLATPYHPIIKLVESIDNAGQHDQFTGGAMSTDDWKGFQRHAPS